MAFLQNCKKVYQSSENNLHSVVEKHCTVGDSVLRFKKVNLLKTRSPILPQQRACNMAQYVLGGACPSCMIHEVQGRCWPVRSTCEGQGSAGNRRVCRWPSAIRMKSSSYHHSVPMLFTTGWGGENAAVVRLAWARGSEYLPSGTCKEDLIAGSQHDSKI